MAGPFLAKKMKASTAGGSGKKKKRVDFLV